MNIEIANRLVTLRKENNLSQEALAEKLGISRQAVSKWERAEASPDTDNLILLARLYQVSLDDLLKTDDDIIPKEEIMETQVGDDEKVSQAEETEPETEEYVHVGFKGIHVKDKDGEVHVGWNGIHVTDSTDDVHIDKNGVYVNGEKAKGHIFVHGKKTELPLGLIALVIYIIIGCVYGMWHPGWLIFLLVPIIGSVIQAIKEKRLSCFCYPLLVICVFLFAGFVYSAWHPMWVVFLTIPVYYELFN